MLPPLSGVLLTNRILWIAIAALLFGVAYSIFRFETKSKRARAKADVEEREEAPVVAPRPVAVSHPSKSSGLTQLLALARFDMASVFRSPAYFVLLLIGVLNAGASAMVSPAKSTGAAPIP